MPLKTRRLIFYGFLFLFIICGLTVISYCQGWRFNWEDLTFQKTGAIFIEARPKGATIKIDGKIFQDKSGLIQSGTLISNLSPKNYQVEIKKDGYLPWIKNLRIESGLVTEISRIILVPEKIKKESISLSKPVENFWPNAQQKIVFQNKGVLYFSENSSLTTKLRGNEFIQWSEDGNKIITQDSKTKVYYLYELNNLLKALNINAAFNNFKKTNVAEAVFNPIDSVKLVIKDVKGFLYLLDINRPKLEDIVEKPISAWTIKNSNLYYIKETGGQETAIRDYTLVSFNLVLKTEDFSFKLPLSLTENNFSKISVSGNKIAFLTESGDLYLFNRQDKSFKQIAHSAEKFIFSPDNKKIVFLDKDGKINVYFLEDYRRGFYKKAGEIISLNLYLKKSGFAVKNIFWHKDSGHLLIEYIKNISENRLSQYEPTSLDFVEIDDRLPLNKYTLVEGGFGFHYEPGLNRLYFIQENNPYAIEI